MARVVVINHVTLDGVMQDRAVGTRTLGVGSRTGLGGAARRRRHCRQGRGADGQRPRASVRPAHLRAVAGFLERQDGPFMDTLNNAQKYVASHNPATSFAQPRDEARMAELDASGR
jgi:hypothetical protein